MQNGVRDAFTKFVRVQEGVIDFMYVDNKGYVTVGIGMKIHTVAEQASWIKASLWELKRGVPGKVEGHNIAQLFNADWIAVDALGRQGLKQQLGANLEFKQKKACAEATKLRLTDAGLQRMFERRLNSNEATLRKSIWFQGWDNYPGDAQLVLLDLAWWLPGALAAGGTFKSVNFRPLCVACKKLDFAAAAKEVVRWHAKASRKKARQTMFMNAAVVSQLKWPVNRVYYPNDLSVLRQLHLL